MSWNVSTADWADIGVPLNPTTNSTADSLTDVLHIASSGNVGVNKSNPAHTLDVGGDASFQNTADSTTAFQIQNAAGTPLLTADTTNMKITVTALVVTGDLTVNGHVVTGGSTPTFSAGAAAACSGGGSVGVTGDDTSGTVSITTGAGPCSATGGLINVTFANAFASAPHVLLTPAEPNAATLQYYYGSSTTGFTISTGIAPAPGTTYNYSYWVVQ